MAKAVDPVTLHYQGCLQRVRSGCRGDKRCTDYYTAACFADAMRLRTLQAKVLSRRGAGVHGLGMTDGQKGMLYLGALIAGGIAWGLLSDRAMRA
jgi:hypothetical protein